MVILMSPVSSNAPTSSSAITTAPMLHRHLRDVRRIDATAYAEPWSKKLWQRELDRGIDRWYRVALIDGQVVGLVGALRAVGRCAHPDRRYAS